MGGLTTLLLIAALTYVLVLFMLSGRDRAPVACEASSRFFVFLVPCLNEKVVIRASLERLLALPQGNWAALVIDDGSDDGTSEVVRSFDDPRVMLLRRELPDARRGKGEALNAAYRAVCESSIATEHRADDVIIVIVDADGRLAPHTLSEVTPYFDNPEVGAVQIGVRMYNAETNLLTRMQDIEFVTFTEVFQRGRQSVGSVGLGGNGQFTRLSALQSLGRAPWTDCLTEDLDLGIRLMLNGWKNRSCPRAHVSQQAVTTLSRLVRQRTRWFQGHLQCWARVPAVIRSRALTRRATADLTYHLMNPGLLLLMCAPMLVGWIAIAFALVHNGSSISAQTAVFAVARVYVVAFLPAWIYGPIYARRSSDTNLARGIAYGHAYVFYNYLWIIAGWRATGRMLARRSSWSKTTRTADVGTPRGAPIIISPKEST